MSSRVCVANRYSPQEDTAAYRYTVDRLTPLTQLTRVLRENRKIFQSSGIAGVIPTFLHICSATVTTITGC